MKRETEPVGSYEFDAHPDFPPKRYAEYRMVDIIPERTEGATHRDIKDRKVPA